MLLKRRTFLQQSTVLTTGLAFRKLWPSSGIETRAAGLYQLFRNPPDSCRPFVRWWWNGIKVEAGELARELRVLKEAGICGVEINPVKFPAKTNDLGKKSLEWLGPEWINLLKFTFREARSLGMTCDLIVGSGWPLGGNFLEGEERSQVVVIGTMKLEGPSDYTVPLVELFNRADPSISSPFPGRKMEMLRVLLVPANINNQSDVTDLSSQIQEGSVHGRIQEGIFFLYALVKISSFMQVIQGAPGADGPVLNHYNKTAVEKYLTRMSGSLQKELGPLKNHIRSFFSDSLELEGANWSSDMAMEFKRRRGYDLLPLLPFILYKIMGMGNTWDYHHGATHGKDFDEMIRRMRYDFELTKTELIRERFLASFINWCRDNQVKSRVQAYGRGYFPLEGSFEADIPECETWIKSGLGTEMSGTDYRVGRAYTMINKYVSSAAHLKGKREISCEELTNIGVVFNESMELMKIAGDQSIVSGSTHPVFHGFNYSPPEAQFPGWVLYGSYLSEKNPLWPYFHLFTQYKSRLTSLLQQAEMFADIAILPPVADMWSRYGAQNEPFPSVSHPPWLTFIWEAIHQNGNGCDYVSEPVIRDSVIQEGYIMYGSRKYHTLFLVEVESMEPATIKKLVIFVASGGRIFCLGTLPHKALGWNDHVLRDQQVQAEVMALQKFTDRFIPLQPPENNFTSWFHGIQQQYAIVPYVFISRPDPFISQVRYQAKDMEILLFTNSSSNDSHTVVITPGKEILSGKYAWLWDPETGERFRMPSSSRKITIDMGPADCKLLVFDQQKKGNPYIGIPVTGHPSYEISNAWTLELQHINGHTINKTITVLQDLKDLPGGTDFSGTVIYRVVVELNELSNFSWLNLGKVHGVAELLINGIPAGKKWYGRRIFPVRKFLQTGMNTIEVKLVTTTGNYLKSLKENLVAQYWTNEGRTIQPLQSMGLLGPVTLY